MRGVIKCCYTSPEYQAEDGSQFLLSLATSTVSWHCSIAIATMSLVHRISWVCWWLQLSVHCPSTQQQTESLCKHRLFKHPQQGSADVKGHEPPQKIRGCSGLSCIKQAKAKLSCACSDLVYVNHSEFA